MRQFRKASFGALFAVIFAAAPAFATPSIRALIDQGEYAQAQSEATALQTADGYALAAESLNALVLLGQAEDLNDMAKDALELAKKALALDPAHANARMQEALADGFVTRTTGTFKAWRKKLPAKTLAKVTALYDDYPNEPRAKALLGAWHLGVVCQAGEKNGNKMFGASAAEGRRLYDMAQAQSPNDILIATNYAASLFVLDRDLYGEETHAKLVSVAAMTPQNDVERRVQSRAAEMLALMEKPKKAKKFAENFLDGDWD